MSVKLLSAQMTDLGGREENQDYKATCKFLPLQQFIVADGLGGQGGGRVASIEATQKMLCEVPRNPDAGVKPEDYFSPAWLTEKFELSHHHVRKEQTRKQELSRMATTMLVLMIMDDKAIWGHVGDSRLYLFREGKIHRQTRDHSVPQMLVSSGEITEADIRHHPDRNRLLRALGDNREKIQARVHEEETLQEGDVFLLCTDGFWEYVTEDEMLACLYGSANPDDWLKRMEAQYLIPATEKEARQEGKAKADNDNYTAIAVWYGETPSAVKPDEEENENADALSVREKITSWFSGLGKQLKDEKQHLLQTLSERKAPADTELDQGIPDTLPDQPHKPAETPMGRINSNRPEQTKISPEQEALDRKLASIRADHPSRYKQSTSKQSFWRFWK